ncbi:MAG: manganese efflux pump, partial [Clostridia bacterium]|nr:manganese efflux pump [Clostridia bacterium]
MDLYFTLLSSAAVSIDALVAGAALGARCERKNLQTALLVLGSAVAALCAAAYLLARGVNPSLPAFCEKLGGPMLIAIAFSEWIKKDKNALP